MIIAIAQILFSHVFFSWLLLFLGDFLSTFCYHIPEHVFGKLHLRTHHASKKTFQHYAVLAPDFNVLLDGLLGALPYFLVAAVLWRYCPIGMVIGLLLGQVHVWWRHTNALSWSTPRLIVSLCRGLGITTPEQHWLHHQKVTQAFGDIFTCFDQPARAWFRWLRWVRWYVRSLLIQPS